MASMYFIFKISSSIVHCYNDGSDGIEDANSGLKMTSLKDIYV